MDGREEEREGVRRERRWEKVSGDMRKKRNQSGEEDEGTMAASAETEAERVLLGGGREEMRDLRERIWEGRRWDSLRRRKVLAPEAALAARESSSGVICFCCRFFLGFCF